jgi:hypothetical protein
VKVPEAVTQLMAGGALAVIVLREVFAFLGKHKRNGNSKSGEMDPAFWQREFRAAVKDAIREDLHRIEDKINRLLDEDERDRRD